MAGRFDFIKREFISKDKANDSRIIVRIDNDPTWLWGAMSISNDNQNIQFSFSGRTEAEMEKVIDEIERMVAIQQEFLARMKAKAISVKKEQAK